MLEAVISRPELPGLDITDEVLREERAASPEAIQDVDSSPEAFLLRTRKIGHRAPNDGSVEVEAQHQIRAEASSEAREIITAIRPDEV